MLSKKGGALKSLLLSFIVGLIIFPFDTASAFKAVQIDQAKIRLIMAPGTSKTGRLEVVNDSEEPKQVKVYTEDWAYDKSDGSKNFFDTNTTFYSCSNWISFSPAEFNIPAFGKAYVNYVIKMPADVPSGGYYSVLFFESIMGETKPEDTIGATAVVPVAIRVGTLFYIETEGGIHPDIELGKFKVERQDNTEPFTIDLAFENTGNIDLTCGGTYNLMDDQNMVYARGELSTVYTMPKDKADFVAKWKESIPKGSYDLVITLDLGKAWEEFGVKKGPVLVKEARVEIGANGEVVKVGELK